MPELRLLDNAVGEFCRRLSLVDDAQWNDPTPCEGWTVRDLVEHVVAGNRLAVSLLTGRPEALDGRDDEHTGAELIAEFNCTLDRQRTAFESAEANLDIAHPAGRITASQFVTYRAADIAVHAWDLARAIGAEERLPEKLIEHALRPYVQWVATLSAEGMFGDGPSNYPPARPQDHLLDRLGRRP